MRTSLFFYILICFSTYCFSQNGMIAGTPSLAYWKVGQGKKTIIVLHGGPATRHDYLRPEFDKLSDEATIIYYDQRGCGLSENAESYGWTEHVTDLKRVIRTVANEGQVILTGSSWGTLLALAYTLQYPADVDALILTGTVRWPGLELSTTRYEKIKAKLYHPPADTLVMYTISEVRYTNIPDMTTQEKGIVHRKLTSKYGAVN